jgi:DNA adenine methylase
MVMKYMGSKDKISKEILSITLKDIKEGQYYIEPFVGGMNIMDKVPNTIKRIATDYNPFLIAMWIGLQNNFEKPLEIPKPLYDEYRSKYNTIKKDKELIKSAFLDKDSDLFHTIFLIGWIGFMASFNGRFYDGGYSGKTDKRDYVDEQIRNTLKQVPFLEGIDFRYGSYDEINIPDNSVIYCDIPYSNTKQYDVSKDFNYGKFWGWCRKMIDKGHKVFVSEYNAPDDFECVWEKEVTNSMNTTKTYKPIEKLFTKQRNMDKKELKKIGITENGEISMNLDVFDKLMSLEK